MSRNILILFNCLPSFCDYSLLFTPTIVFNAIHGGGGAAVEVVDFPVKTGKGIEANPVAL